MPWEGAGMGAPGPHPCCLLWGHFFIWKLVKLPARTEALRLRAGAPSGSLGCSAASDCRVWPGPVLHPAAQRAAPEGLRWPRTQKPGTALSAPPLQGPRRGAPAHSEPRAGAALPAAASPAPRSRGSSRDVSRRVRAGGGWRARVPSVSRNAGTGRGPRALVGRSLCTRRWPRARRALARRGA